MALNCNTELVLDNNLSWYMTGYDNCHGKDRWQTQMQVVTKSLLKARRTGSSEHHKWTKNSGNPSTRTRDGDEKNPVGRARSNQIAERREPPGRERGESPGGENPGRGAVQPPWVM